MYRLEGMILAVGKQTEAGVIYTLIYISIIIGRIVNCIIFLSCSRVRNAEVFLCDRIRK